MTPDTRHVTCDTWHVTHDTWGVNILSKFQLPSSYGLWFMIFWRFGGKGLLTDWLNHEGVCRTAPATPGLLNMIFFYRSEQKTCDSNFAVLGMTGLVQLTFFLAWTDITDITDRTDRSDKTDRIGITDRLYWYHIFALFCVQIMWSNNLVAN